MAERVPRPDRVEGRALSPRAFRPFGIEAVVLGPPTSQEGLVRREGVAVWRRMAEHGPVFDRLAATAAVDPDGLLPVRVVVAATPARDRAMRVPAIGDRATRVEAATEPPPPAGWLLLVDEGPGETWLYLPEEDHPSAVLDAFLGRRGRTDFARARRRSGVGSLASLGLLLGLFLVIYGSALNLGPPGQLAGAAMIVASLAALITAQAALACAESPTPAPGGWGGGGRGWTRGSLHTPWRVPGRPVRVATLTTRCRGGGGQRSSARRRPGFGPACLGKRSSSSARLRRG